MVKLVELFDRVAPWEWAGTQMGATMATFAVGGVDYLVGFNPYDTLEAMGGFPKLQHEDVWLAGFAANIDGDWRQDTVGGSDVRSVSIVIHTFLRILQAFLEDERPAVLAIPAVMDREKIYAQIAKRVAKEGKKLGYEFTGKEEATFPQFGRSVVFYFVRSDLT